MTIFIHSFIRLKQNPAATEKSRYRNQHVASNSPHRSREWIFQFYSLGGAHHLGQYMVSYWALLDNAFHQWRA